MKKIRYLCVKYLELMRDKSINNKVNGMGGIFYEALALFLDEMRDFTIGVIEKNFAGQDWEKVFSRTLTGEILKTWKSRKEQGTAARELLDYGNLFCLATNFRYELKKELKGRRDLTSSYETCMTELKGVRNQHMHFSAISDDDKERAYSNMIKVANILGMTELRNRIVGMKDKEGMRGRAPEATECQPNNETGKRKKKYDAYQQKVIEAEGGRFLVLAPPGSGKTEVLSERILRAREKGVSLEDMACLTYTNRASREMMKRVVETVGTDAGKVFVGNIHKYCHKFLLENGLMTRGTTILGDDEMNEVIINNCLNMGDSRKAKEVEDINNYITQRQLGHPESATVALYPSYVNDFNKARAAGMRASAVEDATLKAVLKYREFKEDNDLMTYSDLLILAYEHLHNDREHWYKRFKWIEVDEVQDLTPLQLAIVDELTDTSDSYTVIYLGDEQQAIFSFVGAKIEVLRGLRDKCGASHVMRMGVNYRSPKYLLDVFNAYVNKNLKEDKALLPHCQEGEEHGAESHKAEDISLTGVDWNNQNETVANIVAQYAKTYPEERTAVTVYKNDVAALISRALDRMGVRYYAISGGEVTATKGYRIMSSLINVCVRDDDKLAWARLISGIDKSLLLNRVAKTLVYVMQLRRLYMTPFDIMSGEAASASFAQNYLEGETVVISLETTGRSITEDDIVRVDALKVKRGRAVEGSRLCLRMESERMTDEDNNGCCTREEGLARLIDYIGDDALVGFDMECGAAMIRYNLERSLPDRLARLRAWDMRRMTRLVEPKLRSYTPDKAALALGIDCDIADKAATVKEIADYCANKIAPVVNAQRNALRSNEAEAARTALKSVEPILNDIRQRLFERVGYDSSFADEVEKVYSWLKDHEMAKDNKKINLIIAYIRQEWTDNNRLTLYERLSRRATYLNTIKEEDLVNSKDLIDSNVFIMTIHKAKGLEFENVVIPNVQEGIFPNYYNRTKEQNDEDARKLYVAMTRATKRLHIVYANRSHGYTKNVSPFIDTIIDMFKTR